MWHHCGEDRDVITTKKDRNVWNNDREHHRFASFWNYHCHIVPLSQEVLFRSSEVILCQLNEAFLIKILLFLLSKHKKKWETLSRKNLWTSRLARIIEQIKIKLPTKAKQNINIYWSWSMVQVNTYPMYLLYAFGL